MNSEAIRFQSQGLKIATSRLMRQVTRFSGSKSQVSTEGGTEPVWARNGRELFYRNGDKMMVAAVQVQPVFATAKPKVLFQGDYETYAPFSPYYDVSPDGLRFLMVKADKLTTSATQINFVQNWFEELKRRVPTGKCYATTSSKPVRSSFDVGRLQRQQREPSFHNASVHDDSWGGKLIAYPAQASRNLSVPVELFRSVRPRS
jgi:hypothetical protein